ncbi:MAG TPA: phosphatase PAP2 family protein, partial [Candidatus Levybacteria bacterium]|nr:phosphatase PAP2 family protein [Candidatus Levybacteria bacterium]
KQDWRVWAALGLVLLVLVFLFLVIKKHGRDAFIFVILFGIGVCINLVLKEIIGRDRPTFDPLILEPYYSFPSGHAMNAFVFYFALVVYIYRFSRNFTFALTGLVVNTLIVLFIGISRVYLGVHYVSDVLAGFVAGLWWVATALVIDKTLFVFWRRKRNST